MAPAAGNNDGDANRTTVFIATSLDTRLVTTASNSHTVSDFKRKIMAEHLQCFPAIGNIVVHSLKVKRRGVFYHLSDSMLVKSAFGTTKRNWFVSADASSVEQDINIQHFDKHKVENELALPRVTQKTVPFENQIVSNVDDGSCKDVSKNLEEDMFYDDKQLAISKDIHSKKRARDASDENLLKDPSECGLPAKKKRKTRRVKSNVKASEENIALANDDDKAKDGGVSMNNENTFEHKSKDNDLFGEKRYDLDQVAAVVPSSLEDVGRETVADVAMVAEMNIQHGMCEKEKENELVQKTVMENEIPSLLARASDCEPDAAALTAVATLERGSKRSTKHKAPKKEIFSTSLIKELDNINTEDIEFTLKQEPEVKLPERRKKVKKSAAKIKNETLVTPMRADDNPVGDVSSTVLAPISDENIAVKNEVLETTLVDDIKKNDEMIVKMEVSEPSKSHRNRARVENMDEISKSKLKDGSRRRKKDVEKTGLKIDETVVKQPDDVATSMDDCARNDDILMNNDVLIEVKVEDIDDIKTEKQNEMMNVVKKSTRKKKTKKSASRNEDESMTKHVKVEISDNVKHRSAEVELESKKSQSIDHEDISKNKNASEVSKVDNKVGDEEKKNSLTGTQDQLSKLQPTKVELESKKSQSVDHGDHLEETSKNVTVAEVSKVNDEVDITNDGSRELKFMDHFAPGDQPNKTASVDNQKATEKPKKEIKDGSMNDGEKIISTNEGLVKVKKNNKSSLTGQHDRVSKLQSAETKLEINKSQSTDHHHDPEDTSQNKAGSHEINFMDYFAPSHQPNKTASIDNRKDTKKPKKIISKNKNNKVVTSPNIPNVNQIKTPKTTRNIDAESSSSSQSFRISFHNQKNNKQPSVVGPVKKVLPAVHNWLKTPAKIFGDYDSDKSSANDNATVNSDSTRRTPSRNPSSSSSSSGDSATSIYLKRNRSNAMKRKEDGGKNSMMSQSNLKKNMSMSDLLRSSSRFKKAKFTASQTEDTESQPVDFVSDSQPLA